jgi:hypothetical protein
MSTTITAPLYGTQTGSATSVDTSGTEIQMAVPTQGIIKRVRAYRISGGMATFDLVTLRAETGATVAATPLSVIAEYGPGSASIDEEEDIFYSVPEVASTPGRGIIYFFVDPNAAINNSISVSLDIQTVR